MGGGTAEGTVAVEGREYGDEAAGGETAVERGEGIAAGWAVDGLPIRAAADGLRLGAVRDGVFVGWGNCGCAAGGDGGLVLGCPGSCPPNPAKNRLMVILPVGQWQALEDL